MRLSNLRKGLLAFNRSLPNSAKATLLFLFIFAALFLFSVISDRYAEYRENHPSPSDHLRIALAICPKDGTCENVDAAISHLQQIPANAPEYQGALNDIVYYRNFKELQQFRQQAIQQGFEKRKAEHDRLISQSEESSRTQMLKNVAGEAHDSFYCDPSLGGAPDMSFDFGHYWWSDDGRCTARLEKEREAKERAEQEQRAQQQKQRDADAELSSYWPTTLRVDSDIDSSWLPDEERTCQTHPDNGGRIAVVVCKASGSHRDHNIPVEFWGGVDRNTASDWKCRREKSLLADRFVCRAIN